MPLITIMLLLLSALALPLQAAEDFDRQQIIQRIQPIGSVRIEGETEVSVPEAPIQKVAQAESKKVPGQETYENHCIVCHKDGVAGAPKFQNASDWAPRLATMKIDELTQTAIKGINAMPPKGTCTECSDEDIKNAIQYMLPKS